MTERILVVNTGSNSLKLAIVEPDDVVHQQVVIEQAPDADAAIEQMRDFVGAATDLVAVAHRVVHGGRQINHHQIIDDRVRTALHEAISFDPMHMTPALEYIDRCREMLPGLPHIACLDTAFHASMPTVATTYAVPLEWRDKYGIQRFGFHGLSHAWAAEKAAQLLGLSNEEASFVSLHLGGGCSACAIQRGRSQWSSMGFSSLEGMAMTTRSGSLDPAIILWLQREAGLSLTEITEALWHQSGLLGLSNGLSNDTRVLVESARQGDTAAELALDVFIFRARQEAASAAMSLGRLDGLIFTGEIGADQPEVRQAIVSRLRLLGIAPVLDPSQEDDAVISLDSKQVPVLLVHPREDLQMAAEARNVLRQSAE